MRRTVTLTGALVCSTAISFIILTSPFSSADEIVSDVSISVPVSCLMSPTVDTAHSASIINGTYKADIGLTTLKVICNENSGFSIYAIGYSNEEFGNNKLLATVGGELSPTYDIVTGTAESGSTSNWAMKLNAVSGTYTPTIENNYDDYNNVPTTYTKVATFNSTTDATIGASVQATYAAYVASDQPAGTYNGKVKYTMVHPASEVPAQPQTSASGKICYYANVSDYEGTMGCQNVSSSVTLLASNFSRNGYGFAGWSDAFDYESNSNANFYGPQETITLNTADYSSPNDGLSLYAVWVKSEGNLQSWSGCSSLTSANEATNIFTQSITALSDQRDNNTYAIAKLADGNCWMIENLRLENTNSDNSTGALAQGYGGQFAGLADAEPAWANNITTANSLYYSGTQDGTASIDIGTGSNPGYRFPRYNHDNTNSRASNPTTNTVAMYSYGNYYTWSAAIADTTAYTTNNQSVEDYSICPIGWHLPTGGGAYASGNTGGVNVTGDPSTFREFYNLGYKIMDEVKTAYEDTPNGSTSYYSSNTTNTAGKTATAAFRSYPNNFVYSGYVYSGSVVSRGSNGGYWSSTAHSSSLAYNLYFYSSVVYPGTDGRSKYYGRTVRCVASGA